MPVDSRSHLCSMHGDLHTQSTAVRCRTISHSRTGPENNGAYKNRTSLHRNFYIYSVRLYIHSQHDCTI